MKFPLNHRATEWQGLSSVPDLSHFKPIPRSVVLTQRGSCERRANSTLTAGCRGDGCRLSSPGGAQEGLQVPPGQADALPLLPCLPSPDAAPGLFIVG